MGKNQSASGLTNIVQYDNDGNISLVSGSTTLLYISSSGAITTKGIISGSNALSASYAASASNAISGAYAVNATTASYAVNATTSSYSLTGTSASYAINATTASYAVASTSGSYAINATTASYAVASTNAANATLFNSTASSVFATTGSNTLTGTQYVSNTNNATAFSNTTASIYTDGGLQITKDAYFSSSMFIKGNLTVFGTQSVSFISSSQLNIGTNLITVNTDTPSIRFGGLAVYDSGSTGLTGSILWDSQNNHWVYTNPSGSSYSGGMFISGPRASSLGSEQGTTLNAIMKGMGGDHITSSAMFEVSGSVGIGTTSPSNILTVVGGALSPVALNLSNANSNCDIIMTSGAGGGLIRLRNNLDDFQIHTNGVQRLTITSTGNVGIGITNPTGILGVSGSISLDGTAPSVPSVGGVARLSNGYTYFVGNSTGNGTILGNGDGTATVQALSTGGSTGYIIFETGAGSEKMRITSAGNVGIGTTNPSTALHISSSSTQVTLHNNSGGTNARRIGMFMTSGDTFKIISLNDNNTTRTDNIIVANVLNGNVGIGTSNPLGPLHIGGALNTSGDAAAITLKQTGTNETTGIYLERSGERKGYAIYVGGSLDSLVFQRNNAGTKSDVMTLTRDGYVGIGNQNPSTKLNVNNTVAGALLPYINATSLSYNSEGISVAGSNTGNANIGNGLTLFNNVASVGAYSPVIAFSSMTSGGAYNATYAFISGVYQGAGGDANWSKGDMIFGTGNSYGATMRLKLTQDGALLPGADNSYGFGGSGIRWAAIWAANGTIQTSDEREKKDIINTDLGLDFINKLRPVSYKWKVGQNEVVSEFDGMNEDGTPKYKSVVKPREGKRTHYGLIAQEVESLLDGKDFGGFVHDKETDIMGLRYDQFVPLLIKSIQELNTKLDAANAEIEALKSK
jgi:hypothetical protein